MQKKILHVLGAMNVGGVESWLMAVTKNSIEGPYRHNFLYHIPGSAFYDDALLAAGAEIFHISQKNIFRYVLNLYLLLKKEKFDVVHSHVHAFSGVVLLIALFAGVSVRISHSHTDTTLIDAAKGWKYRLYFSFMQYCIRLCSTSCLAVSELAGVCLYGSSWKVNNKCQLLYCGVDLAPFEVDFDKFEVRRSLGIPIDAKVIGHVGRFECPKNHFFIIDIFAALHAKSSNCVLLLVGDGSLKAAVIAYVKKMKLEESVIFLGLRPDVPRIMKGAMDLFVFPSLWEGLPLTLIEAQAAGLRCYVSQNVTSEVNLGLCRYLPIENSGWVISLLAALSDESAAQDSAIGYALVTESKFNIRNAMILLNEVYAAD